MTIPARAMPYGSSVEVLDQSLGRATGERACFTCRQAIAEGQRCRTIVLRWRDVWAGGQETVYQHVICPT